jgi:hypothetical protein
LADPKLFHFGISQDPDIEEGDCFTQILDPVLTVYCCFELIDLADVFLSRKDKEIISVTNFSFFFFINCDSLLNISRSSLVPQGSFGQTACGLRALYRTPRQQVEIRPVADWLLTNPTPNSSNLPRHNPATSQRRLIIAEKTP